MNRRMLRLVILFISLAGVLSAKGFEGDQRIFHLLPTLDAPLAVEPYIPRNFVAMSKTGILDAHDWVYWGPKDVLEAYFADPHSLKQSLLRVRLSETVKQISADKFSSENDELCKLLAPMGLKRLYDVRMNWGKYPIYIITAEFQKKWLYTGWVGLCDPQGTTLMFELVYPVAVADTALKPTNEQFKLWDEFLDKTKPLLSDPLYLDGFKISYTPGVTDIMLYGAAFSVVGEQRVSDKLIQVVVDTQKSGFKAVLDSVYLAHISPQLNTGGPGAKVYLSLVRKEGDKETVFTHMLPVIVKPVEAFSVDAKQALAKGDIVYEQPLPCMLKEYLK